MARYQQKTILNFGNSVDVASNQVQRQWQQVGQISSKIGDMAFKHLEKEVTKEATIAGMMAGQSGKPSLKKGFTTYDNVYDKAAIAAYKNSSEVDIIKESARLRDEYKNDPEGMANAFKAWDKGMRDTLDPELYQTWSGVQQAYYKNNLSKAITGKQQADFDANVAEVLVGIETRLTELKDASFEGNDEKAAHLFNSLKGEIEEYANPSDGSQSVISEADSIKLIAKITNQNHSNMFLGALSRTLSQPDGLEKGQAEIDKFRNSEVGDKELGMSKQEMLAKMISLRNQEASFRRNKALLEKGQNKQLVASAKTQAKAVTSVLNNGQPVDMSEITQVTENLTLFTETEQKEVLDAIDRQPLIHEYVTASSSDRGDTLNKLPLVEQDIYNKAAANFDSALKDQGVQFLDDFFGQEFQPIDLSKPDEQAISARIERVAQYEKTLDRIIPLVTPGEAGEISRGLNLMLNQEDADYKGMMDRITSVNDLFGDRSMEVWQDIAEDKQSGIYAVIGDLAQTETGKVTSQSILRGMTIQQTQPKITGLEGVVSAAIGGAYGDNMVATAAYTQAVQALISLRVQNDPIDENNAKYIDEDMLNTAITQVTGGIYEGSVMTWGIGMMGSYKVVLPKGRDEKSFQEFLDNPPNSAVEGMSLPTNTLAAKKERLANSVLVPEGPGRYYVKTIGRSGIAIGINSIYKDDKGNPLPFILDANL